MKTQIKKTEELIIVSLNGRLEFDTYIPLREDLSRLLKESKDEESPRTIIFNLEKLEFVGSSGISAFLQTLREFNLNAPSKPRYCSVKNEFKKMISALSEQALFDFYDSEDRAIRSRDQ